MKTDIDKKYKPWTDLATNRVRYTDYREGGWLEKYQEGGVAITPEEQYNGLNNSSAQSMSFPYVTGTNTFRGLDNGQPVLVKDSKGKKQILFGPTDTGKFNGPVKEKKINRSVYLPHPLAPRMQMGGVSNTDNTGHYNSPIPQTFGKTIIVDGKPVVPNLPQDIVQGTDNRGTQYQRFKNGINQFAGSVGPYTEFIAAPIKAANNVSHPYNAYLKNIQSDGDILKEAIHMGTDIGALTSLIPKPTTAASIGVDEMGMYTERGANKYYTLAEDFKKAMPKKPEARPQPSNKMDARTFFEASMESRNAGYLGGARALSNSQFQVSPTYNYANPDILLPTNEYGGQVNNWLEKYK